MLLVWRSCGCRGRRHVTVILSHLSYFNLEREGEVRSYILYKTCRRYQRTCNIWQPQSAAERGRCVQVLEVQFPIHTNILSSHSSCFSSLCTSLQSCTRSP